MEQAGNHLINMLITRQKQVENVVSFLKKEQCAHSNQIETLAIEVHELHQKLDEVQKEMRWNFRELRKDQDDLTHKVNLILQALAIKY
jgi:phage shock protein A